MDAEERAIIFDLVHLDAEDLEHELQQVQEQQLVREAGRNPRRPERTEADSACRTAACVAPSPPDPDYFVG